MQGPNIGGPVNKKVDYSLVRIKNRVRASELYLSCVNGNLSHGKKILNYRTVCVTLISCFVIDIFDLSIEDEVLSQRNRKSWSHLPLESFLELNFTSFKERWRSGIVSILLCLRSRVRSLLLLSLIHI